MSGSLRPWRHSATAGLLLGVLAPAMALAAPPAQGAAPAAPAPTAPAGAPTPAAPEGDSPTAPAAAEGAAQEPAAEAGDVTPPDGVAPAPAQDIPGEAAAPSSPELAQPPWSKTAAKKSKAALPILPARWRRHRTPEIPATLETLGNLQDHWHVALDLRTSWVTDENYDPFDSDDVLQAVGIAGGRTIWSEGVLSLVGILQLEVGSSEANIREQHTRLHVLRPEIGPELRYHWIPRSYFYVRALPGAVRQMATLDEAVTSTTLEDQHWGFAADFSAGAAFNLAGGSSGKGHRPRFWLSAEGGYGIANAWRFQAHPGFEFRSGSLRARVAAFTVAQRAPAAAVCDHDALKSGYADGRYLGRLPPEERVLQKPLGAKELLRRIRQSLNE